MKKEFIFEPKEHRYTLDGEEMTGVTTILGMIGGGKVGALMQWACNEGVKHVETRVRKVIKDEGLDALGDAWATILKEAKTAHRKKKEDAGTKGTNVHAIIEKRIKEAIAYSNGVISLHKIDEIIQVEHFVTWATENKVKFLTSEMPVYSEKYWYAGTLDFMCEIDGKKFLGDLKTSSGIYSREYFAQCAGYRLAYEEMGNNGVVGSIIVRCGKDGKFEVKKSFDYEKDKKVFLASLDLYRNINL